MYGRWEPFSFFLIEQSPPMWLVYFPLPSFFWVYLPFRLHYSLVSQRQNKSKQWLMPFHHDSYIIKPERPLNEEGKKKINLDLTVVGQNRKVNLRRDKMGKWICVCLGPWNESLYFSPQLLEISFLKTRNCRWT